MWFSVGLILGKGFPLPKINKDVAAIIFKICIDLASQVRDAHNCPIIQGPNKFL
jgi:hypothetical protein